MEIAVVLATTAVAEICVKLASMFQILFFYFEEENVKTHFARSSSSLDGCITGSCQ